jgi:outer membrane protein
VSFRAEHRGPGYRSDEPSERALCGATLDWHFELARGEGDTAPRQRPSPAPDFLAENPASGPTERHHVRVNHLPNGGPAVLASAVLLVASLAPAVGGGLPLAAQDAAGARAESPVPPVELSLDRALELARQNNPDFRIQATQVESADREIRAARGDFLPTMNLSNSYGYQASGERRAGSVVLGTQPQFYSSSYSVNVSYSLNGATLLRPGQARSQADAARARVSGAGVALRAEVTDAYLSVLQADAQVVQAETALERTRLTVRQSEAQVEVGAATPLDIRRAEVQEGQAEVQLVQSRAAARSTRLALSRSLGVELGENVRLTTPFDESLPDLDAAALVAAALDENPVVRATRLELEAARVGVRTARSAFFPNLSLSAGVSGSVFVAGDLDPLISQQLQSQQGRFDGCVQDNRIRELLGDPPRDCAALNPELPGVVSDIRSSVEAENSGFPFDYRRQPLSLSMSLSIPVFTGGQRRRAVEQAELAVSNAEEGLRAEELQLRTEVATAVQAVETSWQVVELQERIRATSAEELRLAQERFRLGLASSIEVADAQANLSQSERDEINARYEFQKAIAALESLVGGPVRP